MFHGKSIQIRMVALQLRRLFALAIFATIAGCVSIPDREPVPAELTLQAGILQATYLYSMTA